MKIRPVGTEVFHADRGTDEVTTKVIVTFRKKKKKIDKGHINGIKTGKISYNEWTEIVCRSSPFNTQHRNGKIWKT
jgi:co-chaperonin GroES (HSP10)